MATRGWEVSRCFSISKQSNMEGSWGFWILLTLVLVVIVVVRSIQRISKRNRQQRRSSSQRAQSYRAPAPEPHTSSSSPDALLERLQGLIHDLEAQKASSSEPTPPAAPTNTQHTVADFQTEYQDEPEVKASHRVFEGQKSATESPVADTESQAPEQRDWTDPQTAKDAFIASEVFNRKY